MNTNKSYLTAGDLAKICEVNLKTITKWVEQGRIEHFRTPGNHIRFRREIVAGFLRKYKFAVPPFLIDREENAPVCCRFTQMRIAKWLRNLGRARNNETILKLAQKVSDDSWRDEVDA